MLNQAKQNLRVQQVIALLSVVLLAVKFFAWRITGSVAILTDELESIVNVVAGFFGVYSLYLSAKPKDLEHPYGHGKIEFISAAFEGALISFAGLLIIYKAILSLSQPHAVSKLDLGIYLVAITAIINLFAGLYCIRIGKKNNSLALIASGKHLSSDTYTTFGIIVGLLLIYFTGIQWLDSVVAMIFALIILYTGIRIIRSSVAGIMDEADLNLLREMITMLNSKRSPNWIDLHNMRIIKYGPMLHIDCHLTVPWYFNVVEAHQEIENLSEEVKKHYGRSIELFIHSDACVDFSCPICEKMDCPVRKHPFVKRIDWNLENVSANHKHSLDS
ncbi:MAG: cation transporter [Chitinophagaceae bacterium]|nr:cation transporter [Chitinophagaceae bacterium]